MDKSVGNDNLISTEEGKIAELLKKRNLQKVNENSQKVHPKCTFYTKYGKRFLDLLISIPVFIILLPINFILEICTFLDVGRPILFKQTRVGKNGQHFTMVKFRNMNNKTDSEGKLLPPSERTTKFGKIMRKYSFDELLNFWSVLKGDMSIIGPRPQPVFIYNRMSDRHKMRTALRPGLECPRIIRNNWNNGSLYQWSYENDVWYVENVSFLLDVRMVLLLIKMVFSFRHRSDQAVGRGISYFVGYDDEGIATSYKNQLARMVKEGSL